MDKLYTTEQCLENLDTFKADRLKIWDLSGFETPTPILDEVIDRLTEQLNEDK